MDVNANKLSGNMMELKWQLLLRLGNDESLYLDEIKRENQCMGNILRVYEKITNERYMIVNKYFPEWLMYANYANKSPFSLSIAHNLDYGIEYQLHDESLNRDDIEHLTTHNYFGLIFYSVDDYKTVKVEASIRPELLKFLNINIFFNMDNCKHISNDSDGVILSEELLKLCYDDNNILKCEADEYFKSEYIKETYLEMLDGFSYEVLKNNLEPNDQIIIVRDDNFSSMVYEWFLGDMLMKAKFEDGEIMGIIDSNEMLKYYNELKEFATCTTVSNFVQELLRAV